MEIGRAGGLLQWDMLVLWRTDILCWWWREKNEMEVEVDAWDRACDIWQIQADYKFIVYTHISVAHRGKPAIHKYT